MNQIKRVLIVGGTHGNELIGIYTIRKFERCPTLVQRSSFETVTLLANPKAVAAGTRYIDQDLNRSFATEPMAQISAGYEIQRAAELRSEFGQAGRVPIDLIIDQHSTTSNVGLMLILDKLDAFTLNLAAHLSKCQPTLKVYSSAVSGRNQDSLRSLAPYQLGIEVGAVAHGTLHAQWLQHTEALIDATLDYLEQYNTHPPVPEQSSLTIYQYVGAIDYPRDPTGEIAAMIHPQRQFKDYEPLAPGDPLFLTFDGEAIAYAGDSTVYPVFINEAAYYEKGIALYLTQKQQISIYPLL